MHRPHQVIDLFPLTWMVSADVGANPGLYLPSYSPELNPDEMANADVKQAVTKLTPARTMMQLVRPVISRPS